MLPDTYSELYPGRFLKADLLKGKKVTLTIKNIDIEELEGEKRKEPKVVMSFAERPLELVVPKTNGFCLKRMFGNNPHDWIGKRITLFPSTTKFGRETVDCIRVWGSPDIEADIEITVPQGRKKALEMVMHRVVPTEKNRGGSAGDATTKANGHAIDPRIIAAWEVLGYTREEGVADMQKMAMSDNDYLVYANAVIDKRAAQENA